MPNYHDTEVPHQEWITEIKPHANLFQIPWKEIWDYRELVMKLVNRDYVTRYKQTFFGSAWYVLQPLLTSLMFTLVFNKIAKISTGEVPATLFFLGGTVCWGYFASCVTNTAGTFLSNSSLFDKVYFPRLVVPISQLIVNLIGFGMQMVLFIGFYVYYSFMGANIHMGWRIIVLPLLLIQMGALGLGVGCIVSAVTTRFRDLQILLSFFMQLWMYASCVVYPLKMVPENYRWVYSLNPMVSIIEGFRYAFLGQGTVWASQIIVSFVISIAVVWTGIVLFNKTERTCADII
jgi:lipopolysaccharide transport system permease protein